MNIASAFNIVNFYKNGLGKQADFLQYLEKYTEEEGTYGLKKYDFEIVGFYCYAINYCVK